MKEKTNFTNMTLLGRRLLFILCPLKYTVFRQYMVSTKNTQMLYWTEIEFETNFHEKWQMFCSHLKF
jgi:hypothetical protein